MKGEWNASNFFEKRSKLLSFQHEVLIYLNLSLHFELAAQKRKNCWIAKIKLIVSLKMRG